MRGLTYPQSELPEPGRTIEVAPGVKWLRMPLPMSLDHINLYLVDDDDGWFIVDTGLRTPQIRECWEQIFETELEGKPITGVVVTHWHPDHLGQAGWLVEKWQVPLWMSYGEYFTAKLYSEMKQRSTKEREQYFQRFGMDESAIAEITSGSLNFGDFIEPMPNSFRRLRDGESITIGKHQWQVVVGEGHCPEHACLYNAALGVLLSGDQVLPKITSNVSIGSVEPDANPLKLWLASLEKFSRLPKGTLVLPAHNQPFYGLHERLDSLRKHHEEHISAIVEACVEPKTVVELLPVLFKKELDRSDLVLALGECAAHVNLCLERETLISELGTDGACRYTTNAAVEDREDDSELYHE